MAAKARRWRLISAGLVAVLILVAALAFMQEGNSRTGVVVQPTATIPPPPTVSTLPPATSSTIQAPGSTTADPNTFTTGTLPGPIQVRVREDSPCVPGRGYRVRYEITNDGPAVAGPVTAQLDLQPPVVVESSLRLEDGGRRVREVVIVGTGELITITWRGRTSFPMEVKACPPNPADTASVTTTT